MMEVIRLIDANLDRIGEGLRVLEDISRFILDDSELCGQIKTLRHELVKGTPGLQTSLVLARRVGDDVGPHLEIPLDNQREDLQAVVIANARRVQESLRVIEEFAKLPFTPLGVSPTKLEQSRFTIYELEQRLVTRLLRQEKVKGLAGLYAILDISSLQEQDPITAAYEIIQGGVTTLQLRDKQSTRAELLRLAQHLRELCHQNGVVFLINDYVDVALAAQADGVHLGQRDLPVSEVRRLLPLDKVIGCSVTTVSQAQQAQVEGADYIAVGAIYPTKSKKDFKLVGIEGLIDVSKSTSLPVIAIGGANLSNVEEIMKAGATGIAAISAILSAADRKSATQQLIARIEQIRKSIESLSPES